MTIWIKRIVAFSILLLFGTSLFSFSLLVKNPDRLRAPLVNQIREVGEARLSYEGTRILFRPFPILELTHPRLEPETKEFYSLSAEDAQFWFRFFPLLWGQVQLSGFRVRGASGTLAGIPFERIQFQIKRLALGKPAPFSFKGGISEEALGSSSPSPSGDEVFQGKGFLKLPRHSENFWSDLEASVDAKLLSFPLKAGLLQGLFVPFSQASLSGELSAALHAEKKKGEKEVRGALQYEIPHFQAAHSSPFLLKGEAQLAWHREKALIEFKETSVKTPFGKILASGIFKTETGELEEARLTGRGILLEELARHFPGLQSVLPLDLGFSGESEFDLTLRGTWDYLSFHANWNLTPATLTFGKIFSKPKDFPLGINFDLILKSGESLSGDFSLRSQQTTIKGALTGLEPKTGSGELTLLTNKFDLKEWGPLLTPLAPYQMEGSAKILLNYKGNLAQPNTALKIANITLDHLTVLSPSGRGIRNAKTLLDISPLNIRLKETAFQLGHSPLQMEAELYRIQEGFQGPIRISSSQLDFFSTLEQLKEFRSVFPQNWIAGLTEGIQRVQPFLPRPLFLENFSLQVELQKNKITLQELSGQLLEGKVQFKGETEWPSEKPSFWFETQLEKLALARYFEGMEGKEKFLEGNLFFAGRFQGQGWKRKELAESLVGQGDLSMTNGEWQGLDLPSSLSRLEPLKNLPFPESPSLSFYDLKASWDYEKEKFNTRDLLIHSQNFWIDGEGNLSVEGVLNSKWDVYLSPAFTEQALRSLGIREDPGGKQLGPLPFLLVGNFSQPELLTDDRLMEPFLEAFRAQRVKKFLRKPFLESKPRA